MEAKLKIISTKLDFLRKLDVELSIFGARRHKYQLNPPKKEKELLAFEEKHQIQLPKGYRAFLKHLGNGGVGPFNGLESLESALYLDLDYREKRGYVKLNEPFEFQEYWNPKEEKLNEEYYFDPNRVNGTLKLANYGCGIFILLVINGPEFGHVWVDDRYNRLGIFPDDLLGQKAPTNFLDWYELWLDQSIEKLTN